MLAGIGLNLRGRKVRKNLCAPLIRALPHHFQSFGHCHLSKVQLCLNATFSLRPQPCNSTPFGENLQVRKRLKSCMENPGLFTHSGLQRPYFGQCCMYYKKLQRYGVERKFNVEGAEIFYPLEILRTRYFGLFSMRGRSYWQNPKGHPTATSSVAVAWVLWALKMITT